MAIKLMMMMMMLLVLLGVALSPVKAIDCVSVFSNILPCANYLGNFLPILPGTQCCDAANNLIGSGDINNLCQCFRLNPLASSFLPTKAQQIPDLCRLTAFSPLVKCLTPSEDNGTPFPLTFPLPPGLTFPLPPASTLPPGLTFPFPPAFTLPPGLTFPLPPATPLPLPFPISPAFSFPPAPPLPPTDALPPVLPLPPVA